MEKEKISIIIPIYNAEKYIKRCIDSVINQTYKNLQIILVDDGSKDNSAIICDEYAKQDERITVIHKINEGVSKARNTGINEISGDYVLFVDADDWLEDTMCEKLIAKAKENDSDIVVCEYNNYYENDDKLEHVKLKDFRDKGFNSIITDDSNKYGGFPWNKLIKKEILLHKFNEKVHYYENLLFFLENTSEHTKYAVVHECLYNYCINDNSAVHSKKYSLKRITALDALELVISLVPEQNRDYQKYYYCLAYYDNENAIKDNKIKGVDLEKYKAVRNVFFKDIIKSKWLSKKDKIKLILVRYCSRAFYKFKGEK